MQFVWALVLLIASYAITALTAKPPQSNPPAQLGDFQFPQPDEGTPEIVVFGDVWIPDWSVLWYGNFTTTPIKSSSGKK
jgi:hypothetical protein